MHYARKIQIVHTIIKKESSEPERALCTVRGAAELGPLGGTKKGQGGT